MKKIKIHLPFFTLLMALSLLFNVKASTSTNYTILTKENTFICDAEFYSEDYEILKKGYYIFRTNGDLYGFEFSNTIQTNFIETNSLTLSNYESHFSIDEEYKEPLRICIEEINKLDDIESDIFMLIKAESYGLMAYVNDYECYNAYLYGVQIDTVDLTSSTGEKTIVIDCDAALTKEQILSKYTFTDNATPSNQLKYVVKTSFDGKKYLGLYPIYIEITDKSGNSATTLDYILVHDFTAPTVSIEKDSYTFEVNDGLTSENIKSLFSVTDNYTESQYLKVEYVDTFQNQNNKLGNYSISCSATDQEGNKTTKTIKINIVDTTKPTITLINGGETIYSNHDLNTDEIFSLLQLDDNYDTLTKENVSITSTSTGIQGMEYKITVTATDSSNNTTVKIFNYYINDTTPPSIVVKDTVYLDHSREYTTEELLTILKAAGLISNEAVSINLINQELISSSKEEDVYDVTIEEILENGHKKYTNCTFKYKKESKNILPYIIIPSVLAIGFVSILIIKKRKKNVPSNNN